MGDDYTDTSFVDESMAYFERNYGNKVLAESLPSQHLVDAVERSGLVLSDAKILEVGCGGGANLRWFSEKSNCRCTGIETNAMVVEKLNQAYPNIQFETASADKVPHDTNSFDLVLLSGVLCWIDRNYILQALGEAVRASRRWIVVTDFCPSIAHKVPYKHKKDLFTWKIDYEQLLLNTGVLELIYTQLAKSYQKDGRVELLEIDASMHKSGKYDWGCFKTTIFQKNVDLIPIHEDFSNNPDTKAK